MLHTLRQLGQISSLNIIICLEKNFPQTRFPDGVIFKIELVEPMERVLVGMHIKCVDGKIVCGEFERFKDSR